MAGVELVGNMNAVKADDLTQHKCSYMAVSAFDVIHVQSLDSRCRG